MGITGAGTRMVHRMADGDVHSEDFWLMTGYHSVPEVVINRDAPRSAASGSLTTSAARSS